MESEMYPDYVSYDIEKYYRQQPKGPIYCPMCSSRLSESAVEPSNVMRKEKELAGPSHCLFESSSLYVCNTCNWWCVREQYEFADVEHKYGFDYLITTTDKYRKSNDFRNLASENNQPWLNALLDFQVYHKVQGLPERLAAVFEGGQTWKEFKSKSK